MATLNDLMEFDRVVFVDELGHVHDHNTLSGPSGGVTTSTHLYAPDLYDDYDGDPVQNEDGSYTPPERDVKADSRALQALARSAGWDGLLQGFTGQYGYNGPIMHESEYMGGGLARYILSNPGWYCTVVVNAPDDDGTYSGEVAGWAVAYKDVETDIDGPWVGVVFLQDEEYDVIREAENGEAVDYLAQWDYGQETDDAHTTDTYGWGSGDRVYKVGQYVLAVNYHLGYASLNRRPMGTVVTA